MYVYEVSQRREEGTKGRGAGRGHSPFLPKKAFAPLESFHTNIKTLNIKSVIALHFLALHGPLIHN